MTNGTKIHIESLSLGNFIEHVNDSFISYAASGVYRLGWKGGCYVVLNRNSEIIYSSMQPYLALETYISLLENQN